MAANDYTTVEAVKAELGVDAPLDASYDTLLAVIITQASRALDRFTGREPGAYAVDTDSTRYFDGRDTGSLWIGELAAAPTSVSVAETGDLSSYTAWDATDYLLWPYNAIEREEPYLRLDLAPNGTKATWYGFKKGVKVVGKFGYSASAPGLIAKAVIIQAIRSFKRAQQAYQDVGAISELGQLRYVKALDPDVGMIIEHYTRIEI